MNILATIFLALQIVSMAITGVQQVRPLLRPPVQAPQQYAGPSPQPIPQQPGDEVRYWFDQSRGQWCCTRNGTLYVWGPTR
jgi:hypothetical protein